MDYVVYPGGRAFSKLSTAQAHAKSLSRSEGHAYVENRYTGKKWEYRSGSRSNPSSRKKGTKAERQVRAQKASARRRVAVALAKFLKQANPGRKVPANVRVKRLKGGGFSITPVKVGK